MNFPPPSCHLDAAGSMMLIHDAVFYWSNKAPYKDGYLDIPGIQYPKYPKIISIIPLGQGHLSSLSLPLMLEPLPCMNWFMLIDFNWCFDMFCSSIFSTPVLFLRLLLGLICRWVGRCRKVSCALGSLQGQLWRVGTSLRGPEGYSTPSRAWSCIPGIGKWFTFS